MAGADTLFVGTWNFESTDNFDQYLKAVGVNTVMAKFYNTLKPTVTITILNGLWTIKSESMFKSGECTFRLDEVFEENTWDGRTCETICRLDGDRMLIQEQKGGKPSTIIWELTDNNTMLINYKAVNDEGVEIIASKIYTRDLQSKP